MGKTKELGLDKNGVQKVMRKRDYLADAGGQMGLNLVANLVVQLTYFYTDKVGLAVGGIGIIMIIAKIIETLLRMYGLETLSIIQKAEIESIINGLHK